ncbi:hypothetical protein HH214_05575 [Mucilaginibacter robiniae]|uniref:Lipoprotein n=1 Tax=Mucilaginibacter robiniae TaxID=2728022 RepID=A0A7L5DYV7_9SPHI|nr:hypothetical protein [Mucilaginibacter robiniae]QJD95378.1 hypothetical protein HH214_05575 [Mucilaginibacter robiniae]
MKKVIKLSAFISALTLLLSACHENPHNTFGGPSNFPQDTAAHQRDTSLVGTRTDGREQ